jgi:hypothetical protein
MALEKRSAMNTVYLQAKHYCLWQELKKPVEGCDTVEVTNPKTGQVLTKHGFAFHTVTGRVMKIVKYDTEHKYATRFFGFKLHMEDAGQSYVFDMPYNGPALRKFLMVAANVNWDLPLSLTVFKGKKKGEASGGADPMVIWFRQNGETVKAYFTKTDQHGMPEATQDPHSKEWDFRAQRRWLVDYMVENIVPAIEMAAARVAPPTEPLREPDHDPGPSLDDSTWDAGITDEDVPF